MLFCLINSILCATAPVAQRSLVFAIVFVFVWVGAILIALNAVLLGGKMFVVQRLFFK